MAQLAKGDCLDSETTITLLVESNKLVIRLVSAVSFLCSAFFHHSVCEYSFIYPTGVTRNVNAQACCLFIHLWFCSLTVLVGQNI
jgi:hypothetical protein